jgi:hypothetical protein
VQIGKVLYTDTMRQIGKICSLLYNDTMRQFYTGVLLTTGTLYFVYSFAAAYKKAQRIASERIEIDASEESKVNPGSFGSYC